MLTLLDVRGLGKRFGGVPALSGVDLALAPGDIHALVGENGAGKSTLLKCLAGVQRPDGGTITFAGEELNLAGPREAMERGIAVIHQELNVVPSFTAAEMLALGRPYPKRFGLVDRRALRRRAEEIRRTLVPDLPLDVPMAALPAGQRQMVEILRALSREARLLVLDEPTASLGQEEADRLHAAMRRLAAEGVAILYVSHRLADVFAHCRDVTVLRNGTRVLHGPLGELTRADLVRAMSGTAERRTRRAPARPPGEPVLAVEGLPFGPADAPLSLTVRAGEIVGLYGLVGAGRSSLLRVLWGAAPARRAGCVRLGGAPLEGPPPQRLARGVAYVPEERRAEGLVMRRSVVDNAALPHLRRFRVAGLPLPSRRRSLRFLAGLTERLAIRAPSPDAPVETLSGGNQQKILVGRWTAAPIRLLLLDEPTRGVDVGAKAMLHDTVAALADEGTAVLMASSDIEEVLDLSTRVLVMAGGRIVGELDPAAADAAAALERAFADMHPKETEDVAA